MISKEDIKEFNSSTDEDVQFDIAEKYGFKTPAQFRKALKEQESKNSTKSTPQIKKEEERATEIENAPTKSEQKKIKDIQEGDDLLNKGKPVITLDQIIDAYADGDENVKSILKELPSDPIGGIMARKVVGRDTKTGENVYETNNEYIKRNKAAFDRLGLGWDKNKSDRFLVAKTIENSEVNKAKSDIREGKGEHWSLPYRLARYAGDIAAPRSMEELDRRLRDENSEGSEDISDNIINKDFGADAAENIIQTVASPVTGPLKAVGRLAPKAARVVSKVPGWVGTRILDNLGDVVASEAIDNAIYDDNDPSNPRSDWSGKDIALGGTVNVVAPYMLDRQVGRLGRRLDLGGEKLANKFSENKYTANQLRDMAKEAQDNKMKARVISDKIVKDYSKPYGGWKNVPPDFKNQANAQLNRDLAKAGPDVRAEFNRMYGLDKASGDTYSNVPVGNKAYDYESGIDDQIDIDNMLNKAEWIDYVNDAEEFVPPSKMKTLKPKTDEYGMEIDEGYRTKPKSIFTVLTSDLPDIPTNIKNRKGVTRDLPENIGIPDAYDPELAFTTRSENWKDELAKVPSGLLDRGITWLPNKTGKSEMITSLLPDEWFPTQEETEAKALREQVYTDLPINNSGKNLFSALNNIPYYVEDEDEEDPYDISFMPTSNRYIKKAGK